MTIIHVPRRFTPSSWGGTEQVLSKTLPYLSDIGHPSRIITTKALDERAHSIDAGISVERHDYSYGEWPLRSERKQRFDCKGGNCLSLGLSRAIRTSQDVHIVHCHTGNRLGASALAAARHRHVPCVLTLHGGHFAIPDDEVADLAATECAGSWSIPWGKPTLGGGIHATSSKTSMPSSALAWMNLKRLNALYRNNGSISFLGALSQLFGSVDRLIAD